MQPVMKEKNKFIKIEKSLRAQGSEGKEEKFLLCSVARWIEDIRYSVVFEVNCWDYRENKTTTSWRLYLVYNSRVI